MPIFYPNEFTSFKQIMGEDRFNQMAKEENNLNRPFDPYYNFEVKEENKPLTESSIEEKIDIFSDFLKKKNIIIAYKEYFKERYGYNTKTAWFLNTPILAWVDHGVIWAETREGRTFWQDVNKNWRYLVEERNL